MIKNIAKSINIFYKFNDNQCFSLSFNGSSMVLIDFQSFSMISMVSIALQCFFIVSWMDFNCFSLISIVFHCFSIVFNDFHCIFKGSLIFNGFQWFFHGFHWISNTFAWSSLFGNHLSLNDYIAFWLFCGGDSSRREIIAF